MFEILLTESAKDDLRIFNKSDQILILDTIERQLQHEPTLETKNRKSLRRNELSKWELRIREYRVFYDVDSETQSLKIKAIGHKEHNLLFIRQQEYKL